MALYVPGVLKKIFMRSHLASDITNRFTGRLPAVGARELYTLASRTHELGTRVTEPVRKGLPI